MCSMTISHQSHKIRKQNIHHNKTISPATRQS